MVSPQYTVRVPRALDRALCQAASVRGVTPYALAQQALRLGLAQLTGAGSDTATLAELTSATGQITARLARVERLAERALYVGCAAYTYARAAVGPRGDQAQLTADTDAAFTRQLSKVETDDAD